MMQTLTIKQHERVKRVESLISEGLGNYDDIGARMKLSRTVITKLMRHVSSGSLAQYGRNKEQKRIERIKQAEALIAQGYGNYEEIGERMGLTETSVCRVMADISAEAFAQYGKNKAARKERLMLDKVHKVEQAKARGALIEEALRAGGISSDNYYKYRGML